MNVKINSKYQNLEGQRFERLLVVALAYRGPQGGKTKWQCRCDCGKDVIVSGESLGTGQTKSCGCKRSDVMRKVVLASRRPDFQVRRVMKDYLASSKDRGHEFGLEFETFKTLILSNCVYCGTEPRMTLHRYRHTPFRYNGIDRIDNGLGYIPGNVVSCCTICNRAKLNLTHGDFMRWAKRLADHQNGRKRRSAKVTETPMLPALELTPTVSKLVTKKRTQFLKSLGEGENLSE